jgi:hypothetical protein
MITHREISYCDRAALRGLAASLLTVAVLGAALLAVSTGCRLFPPPTPPTPTTTTTTTTTSTTTTTLPPADTFANPEIPDQPGEHVSHKTYSGTGHAGRVYAIKWPSHFYRVFGARPDNSCTVLVQHGRTLILGWYQLDAEAGHARPGYALLASAGVPLAALTAGDLLVLRVAGRSVAMLRLWDARLPGTVALNAAEAAAIDGGM